MIHLESKGKEKVEEPKVMPIERTRTKKAGVNERGDWTLSEHGDQRRRHFKEEEEEESKHINENHH